MMIRVMSHRDLYSIIMVMKRNWIVIHKSNHVNLIFSLTHNHMLYLPKDKNESGGMIFIQNPDVKGQNNQLGKFLNALNMSELKILVFHQLSKEFLCLFLMQHEFKISRLSVIPNQK
jgi:hypothetical protein